MTPPLLRALRQATPAQGLEQIERLFHNAPAATAWLTGPEHRFVFSNPAYQRLVGRSDLAGRRVDEGLPELVPQGFIGKLDHVYASGESFVGNEIHVQLRSGTDGTLQERVVDFVFQAVPDEHGVTTGIFIQATDVSERVAAQAALRESERKLRAIINSVDLIIWSTRPDGFHDYYNDRWYEYTGVPRGSTDGEEWARVFHPDDRKRAWTVWRHSLATGEPYYIEYRVRHRSGQYRWLLGRAQPVRDEQGRIERWFGSCTDIQDIVDAREVLSRSHEELERQVQERTRQLMEAEEKLHQSQKMEALGQLTGGIAHDVNNMLQSIAGALDMTRRLLDRGTVESIPRFIDIGMRSVQRTAAMTHRLLAFARQQSLEPQRVDVNELVQSMRELVRRTLGESIHLQLELDPAAWPVKCDPNQLESALLNLAINARDAMPQGGELTVRTANVQRPAQPLGPGEVLPGGEFVEITVRDTGTGMSREVASRAFDPFFTTKPSGRGTGLGLSMVYGFTRQSGGYATLDSREGEGTAVSLLLPRHQGEEEQAPLVEPVQEIAQGHGEVLVLVEDNEEFRALAVEALRQLGYSVESAATGAQGAQLLNTLGHVDLLLADIGLPGGVTGLQLANAARESRPELPIILVSGCTREGCEPEPSPPPNVITLRKPVLMDVLLRTVQEALARSRRGAAPG